jgi:hypothetical protein
VTDALKATYADLKTVKTRSTVQIILEMPIEALPEVVSLLGAPVPGNEVWVAIARLRSGTEDVAEPPARKGTLAQQAGILCADKAFWKFLNAKGGMSDEDISTTEAAAKMLRWICQIDSRTALDQDSIAATRFHDLRADYTLWLKGVGA